LERDCETQLNNRTCTSDCNLECRRYNSLHPTWLTNSGVYLPCHTFDIGRKKHQNAPFSFTAFNYFSAGQNFVSNSDRKHHLALLLS